jgi:hypothetical protein
MSEEELMDIDLDIVNLLDKRPISQGYSHYYISVNDERVSTTGGGDAEALSNGFAAILERDDEGSDLVKVSMLSAVVAYLHLNKDELKIFKKQLKKLSKK